MSISQKKTMNNILHNSLTPALYTLEFHNLPKNMERQALIAKLWKFVEDVK